MRNVDLKLYDEFNKNPMFRSKSIGLTVKPSLINFVKYKCCNFHVTIYSAHNQNIDLLEVLNLGKVSSLGCIVQNVLWFNTLYKGNRFVLGLVSFPSKSLEKEQKDKGFQCGCGPWSQCKKYPNHRF